MAKKHLEVVQSTGITEQVTSGCIDKLYGLVHEDVSKGIESQVDNSSVIEGNITCPAAFEDAVTYLRQKYPNLIINVQDNKYYIRFVDSEAENICVSNWGDGVGVTRQALGNVLQHNNIFRSCDIKDFPEFEFFTGISDYGNIFVYQSSGSSYTYADKLETIKMPNKLMYYSNRVFQARTADSPIPLQRIDWNGATISYTGGYNVSFMTNVGIDYYDGILPNQSTLPKIFERCVNLKKMIYPEGVTSTNDNFNACPVAYVEFPTTITNVGQLFKEFRRDAGSLGASNNTGCIVFKAVVPPSCELNFSNTYWVKPASIYVPDGSVSAYQTALVNNSGKGATDEWSSKVKPMSQMTSNELALGTVTQEDINRVS